MKIEEVVPEPPLSNHGKYVEIHDAMRDLKNGWLPIKCENLKEMRRIRAAMSGRYITRVRGLTIYIKNKPSSVLP